MAIDMTSYVKEIGLMVAMLFSLAVVQDGGNGMETHTLVLLLCIFKMTEGIGRTWKVKRCDSSRNIAVHFWQFLV